MNLIKVLYLTSDSSLYGANNSLVNLLQSLKRINRSDVVVNYHVIIPYKGPIENVFKDLGITYSIVYYREDSSLWNKSLYSYLSFFPKLILKQRVEWSAIKKLQNIVCENNIQIIHSNSSVIGIGLRLAVKCKIKHVWHLREFQNLDYNLRPYYGWNYLYNQINKSDAVISITNSIANHFRVNNRSYIFFNAVLNENSILNPCKKESYFLFCGTFCPNKGVDTAIRAFTEFNKTHPGYNLYIAGSAISTYKDYEMKLKKMVQEAKLEEKIFFLGYRKDAKELMLRAQALLMCSKSEAMGRVTPEAMLSNCIVIGYNNAGTKELVTHEVTGFLYDNEKELVDIMCEIIDGGIDTIQIQNNALAYSKENFLEENYGKKIVEVYESILLIK